MNEENLEKAIKQYGDSLPPFTKPLRVRSGNRTRWGVAAIAVAAVGATVVLTAPSASAKAMQRMRDALDDVRTLHAKTYISRGAAKGTRLATETWMKDGIWSLESRIGTPSHASWIVTDRLQYVNDLVRGVTTVEPRVEAFFPSRTALDYVIEDTDTGPMGLDRKMTKTDGPTIDGKPTYRLTLTKARPEEPNENSRAVILVDAKTNLPIWSETTSHIEGDRESFERSEYEFNVPVPEEKLRPTFQPVIDLDARQKALVAKWRERPVAQTGSARLLDLQMNDRGDLFVLFSGDAVPTVVVAEDGTAYLRAMDYRPGGTWGDTGTQKRCEGVRGVAFVPATLHAPAKPQFRITMGTGSFQNPGSSLSDPTSASVKPGTVEVEAKPCRDWPDYKFDLMLALFFTNMDPIMAHTQGTYLEKQGNVDGAVERYQTAYERMKGFIPSIAYRELIPAERLLRSHGRIAEAASMARTIAQQKAIDPNLPAKGMS